MRTIYVDNSGTAATTVILAMLREGDYTLSIEACGFAEDAVPILCARVFAYCHPAKRLDCAGVMYDETRRVVDIEGALDARMVYVLRHAGFTIPLTFL